MSSWSRGARAAGRGLREVLLTLAALGGAVCVALVIMAYAGGYTLIMFKTGSMTPTIPAGSVALVQRIPADEIAIGDVVTVARPDALPITHRVTSIRDGETADQRVITMKGDANDAEDPAPYTVSDVRIVRGSVPNLAYVIVWFGSPWVLGGITLGASVLVVWAFWPRRERDDRASGGRSRTVADAHGTVAVLSAPADERSDATREPVAVGGLRRDRRS
ncbi:signal peptidase I [Streptomyces sp. AC495_CC817]|uniref:signal peptidase I n=1 Tax=Streptomyces sp. AC495_CC817 TaxID=2823900 RepID=UPI001C26DE72|nr:signal peptidase I [Streptomyces sp. AC495_CC817]